jgi:drug/metabolite transporter (DMT)-like permease
VTPQEFGLLFISILASTAGQFFLKAGAIKLAKFNPGNVIDQILGILFVPELIVGLACYGLGAMTYILLLTKVKLSVAAPSAALIYVFSVLVGCFLFREYVPATRLVGLGLIVSGVVLVVWQK